MHLEAEPSGQGCAPRSNFLVQQKLSPTKTSAGHQGSKFLRRTLHRLSWFIVDAALMTNLRQSHLTLWPFAPPTRQSATQSRVSVGGRSQRSTFDLRECCLIPRLTSVACDDLGARVDPAGVPNDQLAVLCLQEWAPNLTRPYDEMPHAVKLLDNDVHGSASSYSQAADRD
jgi:hypothetical protein